MAHGFDLQAAYAVTSHIAVLASASTYSTSNAFFKNGPSNKAVTTSYEGGQYLINAAAGYFTPIKNKRVFESYTGIGLGTVKTTGPYYTLDLNGTTTYEHFNLDNSFKKIYNQTSYGYRGKYFEIMFTAKFAFISEARVNNAAIVQQFKETQQLNAHNEFFVFEPALTIRGGIEKLKFQTQLCLSNNLTSGQFPQDHSHISFGLFYRTGIK